MSALQNLVDQARQWLWERLSTPDWANPPALTDEDRGLTTNRMGCAAHEVGHAVAHLLNGTPISGLAIHPDGNEQAATWSGRTDLGITRVTDDQVAGHQVALFAGEAAAYRYLRNHTDLSPDQCRAVAEASAESAPYGDAAEFDRLQWQVDGKPGVGISREEARRRAAELVERHGDLIDRLTRTLAISGELDGGDLDAVVGTSLTDEDRAMPETVPTDKQLDQLGAAVDRAFGERDRLWNRWQRTHRDEDEEAMLRQDEHADRLLGEYNAACQAQYAESDRRRDANVARHVRDEAVKRGDLAEALQGDDWLEDHGMPGDDRVTCHQCQSWADHAHDLITNERITDSSSAALDIPPVAEPYQRRQRNAVELVDNSQGPQQVADSRYTAAELPDPNLVVPTRPAPPTLPRLGPPVGHEPVLLKPLTTRVAEHLRRLLTSSDTQGAADVNNKQLTGQSAWDRCFAWFDSLWGWPTTGDHDPGQAPPPPPQGSRGRIDAALTQKAGTPDWSHWVKEPDDFTRPEDDPRPTPEPQDLDGLTGSAPPPPPAPPTGGNRAGHLNVDYGPEWCNCEGLACQHRIGGARGFDISALLPPPPGSETTPTQPDTP